MPFLTWEDYLNFYLAFWLSNAFEEAYFHKIKGTETLSRAHKDLNTTDDTIGLRASHN
jgi:hypothetical protein